ncbi:MAG: class I SAM-dependent methyltransferase [Clostridia bacterium]|nr:class I SAM-dependent methyltransferase [Clostridia bacterium]
MKNIEYTQMAYLYDKFYTNKKYNNEVAFIESFIKNKNCNILDAGCGTGNHAKILNELGYNIQGFDKSPNMIEIANTKIPNNFFVHDLLIPLSTNEKYDMIISFFAVFNHLKNYKQFKTALSNLKSLVNKEGFIIIDLHNPQSNGTKIESIDNTTRIMKWHRFPILNKELSKITYKINNKIYKTRHVFTIFKINKLTQIAKRLGFSEVLFFENYNTQRPATELSKNIQMVLKV